MYAITMQNEAINLKESGERYRRRIDGKKGKGETLRIHYKIRKETTQVSTVFSKNHTSLAKMLTDGESKHES